MSWITANKRLLDAVQIINSTSIEVFSEILKGIVNEDDESNSNDQLLVQSLRHIFKKASSVVIKPTLLVKNLIEILKFDADKAEEFVKVWTVKTKNDFGDLDTRKKLDGVAWQLNLETDKNDIQPVVRLQLNLSDIYDGNGEDVTLELNEKELLKLYGSLESVQNKLDAIQK